MRMLCTRVTVEESMGIDHLTEYSRQLPADLISVDVMIFQVLKVIDSRSIDVFHDHTPSLGPEYLG